MVATYPRHNYTFAEYLDFLERSEGKFEYFDGEIYAMGDFAGGISAMGGGTAAHAALGAEVVLQLGIQLKGSPCRVYSSDLLVRAKATGLATYADITIVCGRLEFDPEDPKPRTVTNPTVVVEVASPTSEKRDRAEKLEHYKTIPSLRAAVVVLQSQRLVEVHLREGKGWVMRSASSGIIDITPSPVLALDIDALYAAAEQP
jgi:Uma2 family endonuclease